MTYLQIRAACVVVWLSGCKPLCAGVAYRLHIHPCLWRTALLQLPFRCYAFTYLHLPCCKYAGTMTSAKAFSVSAPSVWNSLYHLTVHRSARQLIPMKHAKDRTVWHRIQWTPWLVSAIVRLRFTCGILALKLDSIDLYWCAERPVSPGVKKEEQDVKTTSADRSKPTPAMGAIPRSAAANAVPRYAVSRVPPKLRPTARPTAFSLSRSHIWPRLVVERRTGDREVAGSSLTHCTVEYGFGQAAHAHLPLSPEYNIYIYIYI